MCCSARPGGLPGIRRGTRRRHQNPGFKQAKRLDDAERSLQGKKTVKAREDVRIATNKISTAKGARIADIKLRELKPSDIRISRCLRPDHGQRRQPSNRSRRQATPYCGQQEAA